MRKVIIGSLIFLAVILLVWVVVWFLTRTTEVPPTTNVPSFPSGEEVSSGTVVGGKTITLEGGKTAEARNFLADDTTHADSVNPGQYMIGNYIDPSDDRTPTVPYVIEYVDSTNYFSIILLSEPLDEVRKTAERFLQSKLALSDEEMCQLRYMLAVPNRVNQSYAGYDLRFSFCPDAIPLSE